MSDSLEIPDASGSDAQPRGPLSDLLIVDLSRVLAGPYATMVLADLGARSVRFQDAPEVTPRGAENSDHGLTPRINGSSTPRINGNTTPRINGSSTPKPPSKGASNLSSSRTRRLDGGRSGAISLLSALTTRSVRSATGAQPTTLQGVMAMWRLEERRIAVEYSLAEFKFLLELDTDADGRSAVGRLWARARRLWRYVFKPRRSMGAAPRRRQSTSQTRRQSTSLAGKHGPRMSIFPARVSSRTNTPPDAVGAPHGLASMLGLRRISSRTSLHGTAVSSRVSVARVSTLEIAAGAADAQRSADLLAAAGTTPKSAMRAPTKRLGSGFSGRATDDMGAVPILQLPAAPRNGSMRDGSDARPRSPSRPMSAAVRPPVAFRNTTLAAPDATTPTHH